MCPIEVIKVGGSLLSRPRLVPELREWIPTNSTAHRVLVVGGGPLVEALRQLDSLEPLGKDFLHWRAIELMDISGRVVGARMDDLPVVDRWHVLLDRCAEPGTTLFLPANFLQSEEPHLPGESLPIGWHVTSDSIAARVAICLRASRLVLLKSRGATACELADWQAATAGGLVDEYFAQLAPLVPRIECHELGPDSHA